MRPELLACLRPNRLVCDLAAVAGNLRATRQALRPGTKVFAALKGDAYGFGGLTQERRYIAGKLAVAPQRAAA